MRDGECQVEPEACASKNSSPTVLLFLWSTSKGAEISQFLGERNGGSLSSAARRSSALRASRELRELVRERDLGLASSVDDARPRPKSELRRPLKLPLFLHCVGGCCAACA